MKLTAKTAWILAACSLVVAGGALPTSSAQDLVAPLECDVLAPAYLPPEEWVSPDFGATSSVVFTPNVARPPNPIEVVGEPTETRWYGWTTVVGLCQTLEQIVDCIVDAITRGVDDDVAHCLYGGHPPAGLVVPPLSAAYSYREVSTDDVAVVGVYEFQER